MTLLEGTTTEPGHVIQANGVNIYYEAHGQGTPLLLLHAGTLTADSWQPYLAAFAEHYHVITPDIRGHGRSDNPTGAMSYRLLADDMAAFVRALDLHKPLIAGYSDGGQIALEIGMRYPDLPQCLVWLPGGGRPAIARSSASTPGSAFKGSTRTNGAAASRRGVAWRPAICPWIRCAPASRRRGHTSTRSGRSGRC